MGDIWKLLDSFNDGAAADWNTILGFYRLLDSLKIYQPHGVTTSAWLADLRANHKDQIEAELIKRRLKNER